MRSSRQTRTTPAPRVLTALLLVLCLGTWSGSAGAQGVRSARSRRTNVSPVTTLSALTSLRNYSFTYTFHNAGSSLRAVGAVHSPTDWKLTLSSVTTYDVGGHGFSVVKGFPQVQRTTFATPEGYHHLNGEHTWGTALLDTTHVTGMRISRGGRCTVAHTSGTIYQLRTATVDKGVFSAALQACVDRRSGALLYLAEGVTGGAAADAVHLAGAGEVFEVTAIGGVGPIKAPGHTAS